MPVPRRGPPPRPLQRSVGPTPRTDSRSEPVEEGPTKPPNMSDPRITVLRAALGFLALEPRESELRLLHRWLDSWRGIGDVVVGMKRLGYEVSLGDHGAGQWIAGFYQGHGGLSPLGAAAAWRRPTPRMAGHREELDALAKDH